MDSKPSRVSEAPAPLTRRTSPVFVDGSGRRVRRVRTAAIAGVTVIGLSFALAVFAMLGMPTVVSPLLPAPAAPAADARTPPPAGGGAPTAEPVPTPAPTADAPQGSIDADTSAAAAPVDSIAPAPAPSATATIPGNARSTDDRGSSATAPGRTEPPTEPTKP